MMEVLTIPEGCAIPEGRTKPWGTSHAVLCAKDVIGGAPFAVVNADDYYGKQAYREIYNYLCNAEGKKAQYCLVGYRLGNTVTDHGSVARGVCNVNEKGYLTHIVERTRIEKYAGGIHFTTDDGATWEDLAFDTPVSMNMWGYTSDFLDIIQADFPRFFREEVPANPLKSEMFLPMTIGKLLKENACTVQVLDTADKWFGVTYAADKPAVVAALREMTEQGLYPDGLWK